MTDVPMPKPLTFKLDVKMEVGVHPKDHVLAIEHFVKVLCKASGKDPAEATMMLLTAAAHLSISYSKLPVETTIPQLGTALGLAAGAAVGWWPPKQGPKTILHS